MLSAVLSPYGHGRTLSGGGKNVFPRPGPGSPALGGIREPGVNTCGVSWTEIAADLPLRAQIGGGVTLGD